MDSLRALAALSILALHTSTANGRLMPDAAGAQFLGSLDVGLTVFFLISGLVLYRPFVQARAEGADSPALARYAWRRALRIVPAYWVVLTISAILVPLPGVLGGDAPIYYGFLQLYSTETVFGGLSQAWSLCVEVTFYAFLPFFALAVRRVGRRHAGWLRAEVAGVGCLLALSLAFKLVLMAGEPEGRANAAAAIGWLPGLLDLFALGMALAVASVWLERRPARPRAMRLLDRAPSASWFVALVAFWAVCTQVGLLESLPFLTTEQVLARHGLYALVAFALLVPAVLAPPGRGLVDRFLCWRPLVWLGLVSYGIYLWHMTVLQLMTKAGVGTGSVALQAGWYVACLAVTVPLAAASWYWIERPVLRVGTRRPPAPVPGPAPATALRADAAA